MEEIGQAVILIPHPAPPPVSSLLIFQLETKESRLWETSAYSPAYLLNRHELSGLKDAGVEL
jgi:hypothetical protein